MGQGGAGTRVKGGGNLADETRRKTEFMNTQDGRKWKASGENVQ